MRDFFEVVKDDGRPWLILGKGPSAERIKDFAIQHRIERDDYRVFALNHAIELFPDADIWHFIDWEVFAGLRQSVDPEMIVMPYFPHYKQKPNDRCNSFEINRRYFFNNAVFYNLSTAPRFISSPDSPEIKVVHAQFFSAEAAFELLAKIGVKQIDTLGIDGGSDRAPAFSNLTNENPHGSYDKQFANIERIVRDYGITWRKL